MSVLSYVGDAVPRHLDPVVQPGTVEVDGRTLPRDRAESVQGHPGVLRILSDDGRAYTWALLWRESAEVVAGVAANFPVGLAELRAVAAGVHTVSAAEWRRLSTATSLAGQVGSPLISTMTGVEAAHGTVAGKRWRLIALVPPGYPLGPEDRRIACTELRVGGRRALSRSCTHPNWARLGGRSSSSAGPIARRGASRCPRS